MRLFGKVSMLRDLLLGHQGRAYGFWVPSETEIAG